MASLFPPDGLCIEIGDFLSPETICLPGGICLDHVWDGVNKIPHGTDLYLDLIGQLGPALTPLQPFFNMLDVALAVFKCMQAIPDAILKLDPGAIIDCLGGLSEAIDKVLNLIPQVSIPKMIIAAITNVASMLKSIAGDIAHMQNELERAARLIDRAADLNDVYLNGIGVCAQNDVNAMMSGTEAALQGIGRVILAINIFMGLIGGPEIPCFGSIISDNKGLGLDVVVDAINAIADVILDIANAIPDPDLVATLALSGQTC